MKNELFKGLEVARKEFNNWQGKAAIYMDFDDMTAWCEVQNLPTYHSEKIICLTYKDDLQGRNDRYGVDKLNDLAKAKMDKFNDGWEKEDLELNQYFAEYLY